MGSVSLIWAKNGMKNFSRFDSVVMVVLIRFRKYVLNAHSIRFTANSKNTLRFKRILRIVNNVDVYANAHRHCV